MRIDAEGQVDATVLPPTQTAQQLDQNELTDRHR